MLAIKIDTTSLRNVQKDITNYSKKVQSKAKRQVAKSAFNIDRDAKREILVRTGRARASTGTQFKDQGFSATVATKVDYAIHIERKKPYMSPAAERERPKFIKGMKEALKA